MRLRPLRIVVPNWTGADVITAGGVKKENGHLKK